MLKVMAGDQVDIAVKSFYRSQGVSTGNADALPVGLADQLSAPGYTGIPVTKSGYLYIYVSNETKGWDVFFDNLSVKHYAGAMLEETHYYPFGLAMAGISSKALKPNYAENKRLYNGKELQSKEFSDGGGLELYDYSARVYDVQIGRWYRTDSKAELYFGTSPYLYALNQPTHAIDPDGNLVIFINGMNWGGEGGKSDYWRSVQKIQIGYHNDHSDYNNWNGPIYALRETKAFDKQVMDQLNDYHAIYKDGSNGGIKGLPGNLSASNRYDNGYTQGSMDAESIIASLARDKNGNIIESIKVISHSMGGVYAKAYIKAILDYAKSHNIEGVKIAFEADFAPYQPKKQKAIKDKNMGSTFQFSHKDDSVAGNEAMPDADKIDTKEDNNQIHSIFSFMDQISKLPEGKYKVIDGKIVPDK